MSKNLINKIWHRTPNIPRPIPSSSLNVCVSIVLGNIYKQAYSIQEKVWQEVYIQISWADPLSNPIYEELRKKFKNGIS